MSRALLAQLPVPDLRWPFVEPTIPLAGGYLAAWARARLPRWRVDVLPWEETELLGDEALARAVLRRKPRWVGLSLYAWNAERSLHLARRLSDEGIAVAVGGPEVTADNGWLWAQGGFRTAILGEGEEAFVNLLQSSGTVPARLRRAPVRLSHLPSPYLSGVLPPSADGSVWLETLRGCPFRCAYCNYGKGARRPRAFPDGWLRDHLAWARAKGVREVYLMDPSFNVRPRWDQTLDTLGRTNPNRSLTLHTELVADRLRPGDAERLARAGLATCEVGLQSAHEDLLAAVGRPWDRTRWARGVRELCAAGVSVVVGLIAGLPGDTPERFARTLDFVLSEAPDAEVQCFPLALLPGTALKTRASELGISAQERPPYAVSETPSFPAEDLVAAFAQFERATGRELDPIGPPRLTGTWTGTPDAPYLSGVRLDPRRASADWPEAIAPRAARNLILWLRGWTEEVPHQVRRLSRLLPHGTLTLLLDDGPGWPPTRLARLLETGTGEHYLDRYLRHLYGPGSRLLPRLVVLLEDGGTDVHPEWLARIRSGADVLWTVEATEGWAENARLLAQEGEFVYVCGEVPAEALPGLAEKLDADAGGVVFASTRCQEQWELLAGEAGFRVSDHRITLP